MAQDSRAQGIAVTIEARLQNQSLNNPNQDRLLGSRNREGREDLGEIMAKQDEIQVSLTALADAIFRITRQVNDLQVEVASLSSEVAVLHNITQELRLG